MGKRHALASGSHSRAVALPGIVTPVSLTLPKNLPWADYPRTGQLLGRIGRGVQWWIGDFLVQGQRMYGEKFAQGAEALEYDAKTLTNLAWVAERVASSRRRAGLSFAHHAEVAALEALEQETWLARAETEGWTRHQLRKALKGENTPEDTPEPCKTHHCRDCQATWEESHPQREHQGA